MGENQQSVSHLSIFGSAAPLRIKLSVFKLDGVNKNPRKISTIRRVYVLYSYIIVAPQKANINVFVPNLNSHINIRQDIPRAPGNTIQAQLDC